MKRPAHAARSWQPAAGSSDISSPNGFCDSTLRGFVLRRAFHVSRPTPIMEASQ
jgi:hypothetical protein